MYFKNLFHLAKFKRPINTYSVRGWTINKTHVSHMAMLPTHEYYIFTVYAGDKNFDFSELSKYDFIHKQNYRFTEIATLFIFFKALGQIFLDR